MNTIKKSKAVFIRNGKAVGNVIHDVFHKKLDSRKHFLRTPPAIAFDVSSIKKAERYGAKKINVYDTYKRESYTALIKTLNQNGMRLNRGFGEQIALPLQFWQVTSADEGEQMELLDASSK
tara:strand:- start:518 stop:880 length:363 start_codon:yes stop_codon:yes gene_type:complete